MPTEETKRVIEIYRMEHETWNIDRLMGLFADDVRWQPVGQPLLVGKAEVRKKIERSAANPAQRRMIHLCEIVDGNQAAVEWEVHHRGDDGAWHPYRFGVNLYEVVGGKITSIRGYGFTVEGGM